MARPAAREGEPRRQKPIGKLARFAEARKNNNDLPPTSNYRNVTPMALTIRSRDGKHTATPWVIDWARYNDPALNAFFQSRPEIQFKAE